MERVTGPFILGEDDTELYQRDMSVLRLVFERADLQDIKTLVGRRVDDILQKSSVKKQIDLISDFTRIVPAHLVSEYIGVSGPDEPTLINWARTIFHDVFANLEDDHEVREKALVSAEEMRLHLDQTLTDKSRNNSNLRNNIVDRLISVHMSGHRILDLKTIRHNLIGLTIGTIDPTSKATAQVINELLNDSGHLLGAKKAALQEDDALLSKYIVESLRLSPQNPFLVRLCVAPYVLAGGTIRETVIQPGTLVYAATSSAMFDMDEVASPDEFRLDRPDYHYLHFGHGLHTCLGRYISQVQILEMAKRILRLPDLRRTPSDAGRLKYNGPFPESMTIEWN
jgi:cytochrome P450